MTFQHKDGTGSLFPNQDKTGPNAPNAKGRARIGGQDFWVSAWTRTTKDGTKFQNLSFLAADPKPDFSKPRDAREGDTGAEPEFEWPF
jgi:hypothetical protein